MGNADADAGTLPTRFGKYEVESLIAVGGMAEVYLARTPPPVVRRVAIKRIRPAFAADPAFVDMLVDEARIAAVLDHPNVVRVLDFEGGETPYLVMEYVDGTDLRRLAATCAERGLGFPPWLAAAVTASAARGLHDAHEARDADGRLLGIVHRDVNPQNVMITRAGQVKVLDFGIARAAGRNTRTRAGVIKGKFAYMAPEQVRGGQVDARTDVFALGILLYELLTGVSPFKRERDEATLLAVTDERPPGPETFRPGIPGELCALTAKALEKRPEDRFQTAAVLADALDAALLRHRAPVTEAHLLDFVSGLQALPAAVGVSGPPTQPAAEPPARRRARSSTVQAVALAVILTLVGAAVGAGLALARRGGNAGRGPAPEAPDGLPSRAELLGGRVHPTGEGNAGAPPLPSPSARPPGGAPDDVPSGGSVVPPGHDPRAAPDGDPAASPGGSAEPAPGSPSLN